MTHFGDFDTPTETSLSCWKVTFRAVAVMGALMGMILLFSDEHPEAADIAVASGPSLTPEDRPE